MSKTSPIMTSDESKVVGWDDDLILVWPGKVERVKAIVSVDRIQLIRWRRFCTDCATDDDREALAEIEEALMETCPGQEKPKPKVIKLKASSITVTRPPPQDASETLGRLLEDVFQVDETESN